MGDISDPDVVRTVSLPSSAAPVAVDPSSFGGTVRLWQRLRVHFNESHHIRIYYVSSWFRSVSEFINMLNGYSVASSSLLVLQHRCQSSLIQINLQLYSLWETKEKWTFTVFHIV